MASSTGGSELFASYEQDFTSIKESIQIKIDQQIPNQKGEERKAVIRAAEREIDEADEILGQMEMEILNIPTPSRTRLQAKLRLYKSDAEKLKRDLRRNTSILTKNTDREELFGGYGTGSNEDVNDYDASTMDQRQRLLSGTERLGQSSRRLEDSHRLALETEGIGINILSTLKGQRETIVRARDTLAEADSHIDKASKTLKGMARRMATNKLITAAIIVILIVLIVLVVWSKL
ncbi:vesicle transport v-snare protein vti1 [Gilbertella persicaria]|uniref:vesicle transport v-snare protein vti1 n=1 Tax=Gilbertella persicaria TaxID=101096 RepID=UPI00221F0A50|nr:vesicle transport v-snare protein vti1 [Gilbertella persicaria]KAI8079635.1 vesicle transport v-snare protein vti1 [Gilbertella persicaria]